MGKEKTRIEKKHWNHPVTIKYTMSGPHYAALVCVKCEKIMRWLTEKQVEKIKNTK